MSSVAILLLASLAQTSTVAIAVDASKDKVAISPYIYGTNTPDWVGRGKYLTLCRSGGNRMTTYNWENNASNAGSDWYNQNDDYLNGGISPLGAIIYGVNAAVSKGKNVIVTVPMAGYVAADKNGGGDVNQTPDYINKRFFRSYANSPKGVVISNSPNVTDRLVYQDQFIANLERRRSSGTGTIWYALDNEPDLWSTTHPRIHPDPTTYAEMISRTTEYSTMVKKVVPKSLVFSFVSYGWNGYTTLQNAPDANGRQFIPYFLSQMKTASTTAKKRLIDVLDLHYYSEATYGTHRVTEDSSQAGIVSARVQATRSLYDPNYTETSWITQWSTLGPINLLPRVKSMIAGAYPDTKLSFTEYNFGGSDISSAIAEADALGAFGREGVFAACLWPIQSDVNFVMGGFDMYRNIDGKGLTFGDTSVQGTSSDLSKVSVWASLNSSTKHPVVILINRTLTAQSIKFTLAGTGYKTAKVYRLTSASTKPAAVTGNISVPNGGLTTSLPAMSVTAWVF